MISLKLWEIINPYMGVPVEEEKIPDPSGFKVCPDGSYFLFF